MKREKSLQTASLFVFLFLFMLFTHIGKAPVAKTDELHTMVGVATEEGGVLTQWQFLARESLEGLSAKDWERVTSEWRKKLPSFSWEQDGNDGILRLTGSFFDPKGEVAESVQIILSPSGKNGKSRGFVLYELKGRRWKEETASLIEKKFHQRSALFRGEPLLFYCIRGVFYDTMKRTAWDWAHLIAGRLEGKVMELAKEDRFVSLSIESPAFSGGFGDENPINAQIAIRTIDGGAAQFTIGTPVITIEY